MEIFRYKLGECQWNNLKKGTEMIYGKGELLLVKQNV